MCFLRFQNCSNFIIYKCLFVCFSSSRHFFSSNKITPRQQPISQSDRVKNNTLQLDRIKVLYLSSVALALLSNNSLCPLGGLFYDVVRQPVLSVESCLVLPSNDFHCNGSPSYPANEENDNKQNYIKMRPIRGTQYDWLIS